MSDGTPLDQLETGDVANAADAQKMQAILSDMNASGADVAAPMAGREPPPLPPRMPPMQPMQPMPPMYPQHMMQPPMYNPNPHYEAIEEEPAAKPTKRKSNVWQSIADRIRDPFVVAIIVFVLSLPVLHTHLSKYAAWAFTVGGQLSWFGLVALALVGGIAFGLFQTGYELILA